MLAIGDCGACVRLSTGTSRGFKSVSFAPKTRTAWVVGDEDTILKTTDGGSSFGVQTSNTSKNLRSVWAVDEQLAYACGDSVEVWSAKRLTPQEKLRAGWLGDDGFAVPVGDDGVLFTNPPGDASWAQPDSGTSRDLNVVIRSGSSLVVVGDGGEVLRSADEGATWSEGTRGSKHFNAVA